MTITCCSVPRPDDLDDSRCFPAVFRRSRRERACCECDAPIRVGDRYIRDAGASDGSAWSFDTCLPCLELRERYCCSGWIFGRLRDSLVNYVAPGLDASHRRGLSDGAWDRLWDAYLEWRGRELVRKTSLCDDSDADYCERCQKRASVDSVRQLPTVEGALREYKYCLACVEWLIKYTTTERGVQLYGRA